MARETNKYLDDKAPWKQIKEDKAVTATTIYIALRAIDSLKVLFAPFLPFTCEALHGYLGYEGSLFGRQHVASVEEEESSHDALCYDGTNASAEWKPSELPAEQEMNKPKPLFSKLDWDELKDELE